MGIRALKAETNWVGRGRVRPATQNTPFAEELRPGPSPTSRLGRSASVTVNVSVSRPIDLDLYRDLHIWIGLMQI